MAGNDEKKKALDAAIAKLEKDFGKGAVMGLGQNEAIRSSCCGRDSSYRLFES